LIDRGQLDQLVGEYLKNAPRAEPPALAEFLVSQNILSPFQAERVLQGKTQGLVLGPYVLVDGIGSGSMGQVFKATSKTDNQSYAVKVLPRRSMWNVRLARRQVRAFGQFAHPAVVPFVDVGTSGGQHYLVWPLVEGETLEARVQREGKLSTEKATQILSQVAEGLAAAHQHGLFHGLLKPSNIMIGSDGQARILDFGIGSLLVENEGESIVDTMSTANTLTSGLDCASPESIMEPTNRTQAGDQYSFGCVLYYCLAGKYPFGEGTAVEKMMAHQFKQPTPVRDLAVDVPEALADVIERLMQKSPEKRFTGVDEIVEALEPFVGEASRRGSSFGSLHGSQFPSSPGTTRVPASHAGSGSYPGVAAPISHSGFGSAPGVAVPISHSGFGSAPGLAAPISHSGFGSAPGLTAPAAAPPPSAAPVNPRRLPVAAPAPAATTAPPSQPASPRPATVTRAALKEAPRAVPTLKSVPTVNEEVLPLAQAIDTPAPAASRTIRQPAPAWDEPRKGSGMSMFLVFLIAALVTAGVYLLGKNFLFTS
jgi:serine/threonine-protein kinase